VADEPERSSEFRDKDEPVSLAPLTPEEALRALLAVKPDDEPVPAQQERKDR
jgi:hypothetical protein